MIKATLLLVSALALVFAATIDTNVRETEGCKYQDEMWPGEDITTFYICSQNVSIQQKCPPKRVFIRNSTVSGCVPIDLVDENCVYPIKNEPSPCEGENLRQPQASQDPTQFYVCQGPGATPVKLTCPTGGFVKQNGYLGCFNWPEWRQIRNCTQ